MIYYNRSLKNTARTLRKNMTDSERILWSRIRRKQIKGHQFYRQKTIGSYIVDFYCPSARIIVELDGAQHFTPQGRRKDSTRDKYMAELGFRVLRFRSDDVFKNLDGLIKVISESISGNPPDPL